MDVKTMRELLGSYRDAVRRADEIQMELGRIRDNYASISSQALDGMPHSAKIHDLSEFAEKVDDLLRELRTQYDACVTKKRLIAQLIDEADTETQRLLLWYRFIKLEKDGRLMWYERIAVETGYSYGGVRYIIDQGLQSIVDRWPEISAKYEGLL